MPPKSLLSALSLSLLLPNVGHSFFARVKALSSCLMLGLSAGLQNGDGCGMPVVEERLNPC